jgi:hypothetical protein
MIIPKFIDVKFQIQILLNKFEKATCPKWSEWGRREWSRTRSCSSPVSQTESWSPFPNLGISELDQAYGSLLGIFEASDFKLEQQIPTCKRSKQQVEHSTKTTPRIRWTKITQSWLRDQSFLGAQKHSVVCTYLEIVESDASSEF